MKDRPSPDAITPRHIANIARNHGLRISFDDVMNALWSGSIRAERAGGWPTFTPEEANRWLSSVMREQKRTK